jgi:hypothetical protein
LEPQLRVYFGSAICNLYAVGFLSTDIHKLIAFSEAIQQRNAVPGELAETSEDADSWFNHTNRYARVLSQYSASSKIQRARNGSLELLIGGMSLVSSIVVPIALARAQNKLQKDGLSMQFDVSPTDKVLDRHIKRYARGDYGAGAEGLNNLFDTLSALGYDVSGISGNMYRIQRALSTCTKRIVKTVRYVAGS